MQRASQLSFSILLFALAAPARAADVSVKLDAGTGFVVKDNTGAIDRLRVDEATGNISRNGALFVNTSSGTLNTFIGDSAGNLTTSGYYNTGVGRRVLNSNTTGSYNSAFGYRALQSNTTGSTNSAFGFDALRVNTMGARNAAFGHGALRLNTTGTHNSAFGNEALYQNTTGTHNSAFGTRALFYSTGNDNSAFGRYALANSTGDRNVAVGHYAGRNHGIGSDNIYLANTGLDNESGQIKIGTVGTHMRATIAGIHGSTSAGGIGVLVNASGVLGTTTSSIRFKQDVRDMAETSDVLMKLRPVVFRYRPEVAGGEDIPQYGLVAEEVADVAPELVANDREGKPYSVKYHVLPALLLNELQEQEKINGAQARIIEEQRQTVAALSGRLKRVEARLADVGKEAPR